MARSRSKYSRAHIRARVRRPRKRGGAQWFYGAMAAIVVLGIVGIVFARGEGTSAAGPPQPGNPTTGEAGDHWHSAFAVNICGEWIAAPGEFEQVADNPNVQPGIHTHGDGFIHTHPFTRSEGGDKATLGRFLDYGGWGVSEDSIDLGEDPTAWEGLAADPGKRTWSDGDTCPPDTPMAGKKGVVKWSVDCKAQEGDPADLKLRDLEVIAIAFLPKGEDIGVPPNASATPAADSGSEPTPLNVEGCSTAGPGGDTTATTLPAATTDTTTPVSTP